MMVPHQQTPGESGSPAFHGSNNSTINGTLVRFEWRPISRLPTARASRADSAVIPCNCPAAGRLAPPAAGPVFGP